MNIHSSQLHFNSLLLVQELEKRGIQVELILETKIIKATYNSHIEIIDDTDLSVMPASLRYILDDKWQTKQLLQSLNFPVIPGKKFHPKDRAKACKYAQKIGFPVVIKPVSGTHGYEVRMNIETPKEFIDEFSHLCMQIHNQQDILVEKQISGGEFRLTVTKNEFFAAVYRIPPSVIGDGKFSLQKLVDKKNKKLLSQKEKNCLCRIYVDNEAKRFLSKKGIDMEYIPQKKEQVFLRSNTNVSTGADCMDVTKLVHPEYKNFAFQILKNIPELPYVGIDLIAPDIHQKPAEGDYYICELNPAPGISLHTHPGEGQSRDFPKALIDLIFPETSGGKM